MAARRSQASRAGSGANTPTADLNEILAAFYCLGGGNSGTWTGFVDQAAAKQQVAERRLQLGQEIYKNQVEQSKKMAKLFLEYARNNGYTTPGGLPVYAWWTARGGTIMTNAMKRHRGAGFTVDQKVNPADILFQFGRGKSTKFLGLSAKTTKNKGEVPFKNPGIGTIDTALGFTGTNSCVHMYKTTMTNFVNEINETPGAKVSHIASQRKTQFRKPGTVWKAIYEEAKEVGDELIIRLRNKMYNKLKKWQNSDQEKLRVYCMEDWMNIDGSMDPSYVKVTGKGDKEPYSATLLDPLANSKTLLMQTGTITLHKVGNNSIGVKANNTKIFKMRWKWENDSMATSMKLSGDNW